MRIDDVIIWLKEWQALLGGFLAFFAACLFVAGSVIAARIRAGAQARSAHSFSDLRAGVSPGADSQNSQPADLVQSLQQLRSLVRSALSALTPSEHSSAMPNGASYQSYERILRLRLEACSLPPASSKTAKDLLTLLIQHIEALRLRHNKSAPASEMSHILIKVNTAARHLLVALASSSMTENPNLPSTLLQR